MPIPKLKKRHRRGSRQYGHVAHKPIVNSSVKKEKRKPWKFKLFLILLVVFGSLVMIGGTVMVVWASKDLPSPDKLIERKVSQSTKIYDRTGEILLYEIFQDQKRTLVDLDQISDYAKNATIAIEDKHFYTHRGIRITSIIRAGINNLLGRQAGGGGASTLTQQLIKNAVVGDEHSYLRKIKEAIMAMRLEKKYDKNQILKMYLNEIPYGSTNYGIEAASYSYFKKKSKDLTLAEAAALAAIPQAPTRYLNDIDSLTTRRNVVLSQMFLQGFVSEKEKNDAINTPVKIESSAGNLKAPHFVLYVKQLLADSFGEKTVDEGGLKVITTLDYEKQKIAEEAIGDIGKINSDEYGANNAALVAIDPKTGEVLAMVGSRDFEDDEIKGKFNVAVLGKRQPGSSFKPLIYAAAFEKGYTPETVVYDVLTNFEKNSGKEYIPKNYSLKEYGLVTLRQALQGSLNIAAVKTLYLVGADKAITFAKKFGYTTLTGDYGLSLVLGGAEVTLYEHTAAFAALANEGQYIKPYTILKVEDNEGDEIYIAKESKPEKAVEKGVAATLAEVLTDDNARSYIFGTNSLLTIPGRKVAAKTGTTDDSKDAWTMGYTPSLVAGVWVGNSTPSAMKGGGSLLAAPIWNKFMSESLKNMPVEEFPKAKKVEIKNPFLQGKSGGITLRVNKKTGNIASSSTPDELVIEKTYLPPHTILHYVNKDNPNSVGSNSITDPQYQVWEDSLSDWIKKQSLTGNVTLEDPPIKYDDPQSAELIPSIKIIVPAPSSTILSRQIEFQIEATAPRGVSEVQYFIDGKKVGSSQNSPFKATYYALKLKKGIHTVKITASDDLGNLAIEEYTINLQADFDPASFTWLDSEPLQLNTNNFPYIILLLPFRWEDTKDLKVYLDKNDEQSKLIYTFDRNEKLFGDKLMFTWNNYPGIGNYTLKGILTDNDNNQSELKLDVIIK